MASSHAKSPCCQGRSIRFGKRRRQCVVCRKTWRVRKKRRGRKRLRRDTRLAVRYVRRILVAPRLSTDQRQRRLAASANYLQEDTRWLSLPVLPPLIAVADAVRVRAEKRVWTIYLILIRRSCASRAWIAEPYMREGKESWQGWQDAFAAIPEKTRRAIAALVSDGHSGLVSVAHRNGWLLQRCHFHLIAKLQGRRSRWGSGRHRLMGEYLYALASEIMTNPDEETAGRLLMELEARRELLGVGQIQRYLSGFFRNIPEYRTYLHNPHLHLPRTSNAAEALAGIIRRFLNRAHGFRTHASLIRWVRTLLKERQTIACNGSPPTKLLR